MVSLVVYPHENAGQSGPGGINALMHRDYSPQARCTQILTGRPVAENRGSGISMMISQVRRDTGLVPLFAADLDHSA